MEKLERLTVKCEKCNELFIMLKYANDNTKQKLYCNECLVDIAVEVRMSRVKEPSLIYRHRQVKRLVRWNRKRDE